MNLVSNTLRRIIRWIHGHDQFWEKNARSSRTMDPSIRPTNATESWLGKAPLNHLRNAYERSRKRLNEERVDFQVWWKDPVASSEADRMKRVEKKKRRVEKKMQRKQRESRSHGQNTHNDSRMHLINRGESNEPPQDRQDGSVMQFMNQGQLAIALPQPPDSHTYRPFDPQRSAGHRTSEATIGKMAPP